MHTGQLEAPRRQQTGRAGWGCAGCQYQRQLGEGETSMGRRNEGGFLEGLRVELPPLPVTSNQRSRHLCSICSVPGTLRDLHAAKQPTCLNTTQDEGTIVIPRGQTRKQSHLSHTFHNEHELQGLWVILFKEAKELWNQKAPSEPTSPFPPPSPLQCPFWRVPRAVEGSLLSITATGPWRGPSHLRQ